MPRALLSVYDKRGLAEFASGLVALGFEVVSTGGSLAALREAGVAATAIDAVTGFPEILSGRVKTLHPRVHGGILARREAGHLAELAEHDIEPIDVVAVNLYPFAQTIARPGVTEAEAIEQIDIGGPAMLRAAAKNHSAVAVVVDPEDYPVVLAELASGLSEERRRALALKAFSHTAAYDAAIAAWLSGAGGGGVDELPQRLELSLVKAEELRYGENPHQRGARYRDASGGGAWDAATLHSGTALSYLNLFDADAAWSLAFELGAGRSAVIVKHANACGAAVAADLGSAYQRALEADPKSAFGGVVALSGAIDDELAASIVAAPKADLLVASSFSPGALALFARKRKNMRVLEAPPPSRPGLLLRRVDGGYLAQQADRVDDGPEAWRVVSRRQPDDAMLADLSVAYRVCARTSSNAIVIAAGGVAIGIGAGQQSRVDAVEIAVGKAGARARGAVAASDAFFPFRDGIDALAAAGIEAVVQPGGSIRDAEMIEAADEHGMVMLFSGVRHFRH